MKGKYKHCKRKQTPKIIIKLVKQACGVLKEKERVLEKLDRAEEELKKRTSE